MGSQGFLEDLNRIRERVNRLFDQALLSSGYGETAEAIPGTWSPPVDVVETPEAFQVSAELTGVRREQIDVMVRERRLELSGRRDPLEGDVTYHRMERSYGPFRWSSEFGEDVDAERISAGFERGVLKITLPKSVRSGRREIPVRGGN